MIRTRTIKGQQGKSCDGLGNTGTDIDRQEWQRTYRYRLGHTWTDRDRQGHIGTDMDRQGHTGKDRDRQGQTGTYRYRQGQTGTDRDRQGQTGTDRDRQGQTGTESDCRCLSLKKSRDKTGTKPAKTEQGQNRDKNE